jgi:hypothetical protein
MEGMVGARADQGQPTDEKGCRDAVRELSAQTEEVEPGEICAGGVADAFRSRET